MLCDPALPKIGLCWLLLQYKVAYLFIGKQPLKIVNGFDETLLERHARRPREQIMRSGNVRSSQTWIILGARAVHDTRG